MPDPNEPQPSAAGLPPGEYAIVELFGHTTLIGRVSEVERFGARMMALEPLYRGELLPAVMHGGAAIYRMTPCSPEVAFQRQPQSAWQLPPAIKSILPPELLAAPADDRAIDGDAEVSDEPF